MQVAVNYYARYELLDSWWTWMPSFALIWAD